MNQDLINDLYVLVNKIGEDFADIASDTTAKMEEKARQTGDERLFERAQERKIRTNEMRAVCAKQRADYPHLFNKEKK